MKKLLLIGVILINCIFCINVKADVDYDKIWEDFVQDLVERYETKASRDETFSFEETHDKESFNLKYKWEGYAEQELVLNYENGIVTQEGRMSEADAEEIITLLIRRNLHLYDQCKIIPSFFNGSYNLEEHGIEAGILDEFLDVRNLKFTLVDKITLSEESLEFCEKPEENEDSKISHNYDRFWSYMHSLYVGANYVTQENKRYFTEGKTPSPELILYYMTIASSHFFEYNEYDIEVDPDTGEEIYKSETYTVPAEVFESAIKDEFDINGSINDEYIAENIRTATSIPMGEFKYTTIGEEQFYVFKNYFDLGDYIDIGSLFIGYKELENDYYELYSYLLDYNYNENAIHENYKPEKGDVYGRDYIIEHYTDRDENGNTIEVYNVVKVVGYIKAKVCFDGNNFKWVSFEQVEEKNVPSFSILKRIKIATQEISLKTEEVEVNAPKDTFIKGTKITVEKQEKGNIFEAASKALKEKFNSFVIYEINAKAGGYDVEPDGKVEILIKVPEGYKMPTIYYVTEDGKLERMDTKSENGYAKAYVTHFSTYAIVDEKVTVADKVEQVVDKVVESVVENPKTGIASGLGVIGLAVAGTVAYKKTKKKTKFPQA